MRKLWSIIALLSLVPSAVFGYTVQSGDYLSTIAPRYGMTWQELWEINPQIENPNLIFPGQEIYTERAYLPEVLGATIPRPEIGYDKNITRPLSMGGSETVVYVSALPNETTGYMIINPDSVTNRELVKYTGVTTTGGNQLTGVTRGLPLYGTTGSAISDTYSSSRATRHSSGERIVMTNGRYEQLIVDQLSGYTTSSIKGTDSPTFTVAGLTISSNSITGLSTPNSSETTKVANVQYVNDTALSGAPNASETVKGNSELATGAEAAAGTSTGGTGARLVLPASIATSTGGTPGNWIPVTQAASGRIDGTFCYGSWSCAPTDGDGLVTPNPANATSTPTASKIVMATSTGKIENGWIQGNFLGTGTDGALSITSGTTTLDIASAKTLVKNYSSISIDAGTTLAFSNAHANGSIIVLKSQGACTIAGTINGRQTGADGGAQSSGAGNNGSDGYSVFLTTDHGDGAGAGSAGTGGTLADFVGLVNMATTSFDVLRFPYSFIGAGGGSGTGNSGTGGKGGDGAGLVIIQCNTLNFTGIINLSGQNGAVGVSGVNPSAGGGGGGGGGGNLFLLYNTLTANSGTVNVAGGTGALGYSVAATHYGGGGGAGATAGSNGSSSASDGVKTGGDGGEGKSYILQNTLYF